MLTKGAMLQTGWQLLSPSTSVPGLSFFLSSHERGRRGRKCLAVLLELSYSNRQSTPIHNLCTLCTRVPLSISKRMGDGHNYINNLACILVYHFPDFLTT